MRYIDVLVEPETHTAQPCFLCGAKEGDGHWSMCTFGDGNADTDPDADHSEQQCELS